MELMGAGIPVSVKFIILILLLLSLARWIITKFISLIYVEILRLRAVKKYW